MYPMEPTQTELLNEFIESEAGKREDIIKEYIDRHDTEDMMVGLDYYFKKNKIVDRKIYKYDEGGSKKIDTDATNYRLASGWHKLLVDQKVGYLVGDPVSISSKSGDDDAVEAINDILGDEFNDVLPELVKNASNKGVEWLHVYLNPDGEFDYMLIPAQEFIPIYDNTKRKQLIGGIRYYDLDDKTRKIELWDDEMVTFYEEINGKIVLDMSYEQNPQSHFHYGNEGQEKGYGWGRVPFIEFANNQEKVADITFYKDYIDAYDYLMSDTTNTLEDIQEIVYILKGYDDTNLAEFSTNVKRYKAIKTSEGGGVDAMKAEVPIDSVNSHLDRFIENIYQYGMGVNTNTDKFGNAPSGVALKNLYSYLDMKANVLERKFSKALQGLTWFISEYLAIANVEGVNSDVDPKDIQFIFNKSMLMNEMEQAQIAQQSKGVISDETIIANHPWVTDPEMEKQRLDEQASAYPSVEDVTDEEPGTD